MVWLWIHFTRKNKEFVSLVCSDIKKKKRNQSKKILIFLLKFQKNKNKKKNYTLQLSSDKLVFIQFPPLNLSNDCKDKTRPGDNFDTTLSA